MVAEAEHPRRQLTAAHLRVLCKNDVEDLVSDVVGGFCVRIYDGDDDACYGHCDDYGDDFSFYDEDDVRDTIRPVRSVSTLSRESRDSAERDDVSRSSSTKTTPTIEDTAAIELAAAKRAAATKSKAAKKKAQRAAAKKKAKEAAAAAAQTKATSKKAQKAAAKKKAKEDAADAEAQESAAMAQDIVKDSQPNDNDNNDSVAHTTPKNLSVSEMEALELTSKILSAVKKYPTLADTLDGLLSFRGIDNEDDDGSLNAAPSKVGALQTSQDPSSADRLDANGNSALHLSAKALDASNVSEFLFLLEDSRDSTCQPNNNNDLPLHIVAATGSTGAERAVMALVDANHTALAVRGARGKTPLHLALAEGSSNLEVLEEILAVHRERNIGVIDFDDEGNTPLHSAIKYGASYDGIVKHGASYTAIATFRDELKYEESLISPFHTKNRDGDLPLHSALHLPGIDPSIITLLLDAAPFAATRKDGRGKMPVELATAANLPVSLVIGLLTLDMPIVIGNEGCIAKCQHGHSWWHVAIHSNNDGKFAAGISVLLGAATPEELIWLARSVGPDGKTQTIDAASEALKAVFKEKLCFLGRYDISINHLPYLRNGVRVYSATAVDQEDGENASTTLRCYSTLAPFLNEINVRKHYTGSPEFVEEINASFKASDKLALGSSQIIAFRKPDSTLEELFETTTQRWTLQWLTKCHSIIKDVASALQALHKSGFAHGHLDPAALGCFSSGETNAWKLMELGHSTKLGTAMSKDSFSGFYRLAPPESITNAKKPAESDASVVSSSDASVSSFASMSSFRSSKPFRKRLSLSSTLKCRTTPHARFVPESCLASPAWDAWALGVIMAQAFVMNGSVFPGTGITDKLVMGRLLKFDAVEVEKITGEVRCVAGVFASDLVGRLLDPNPETRLSSMSKVLRHRYFHEPVREIMKPKKASIFGKHTKVQEKGEF